MAVKHDEFGYSVSGPTVGKTWLDSLKVVFENGETTYDEGRKRLSLQSFRFKADTQDIPHDKTVTDFGNKKNVQAVLDLTFKQPKMVDIDVNPSFGPGAKSYYTRLQEGKILEFVIQRLSTIPESKKAVIVFPTYEDYEAVLKNPWNDYLPCMVAVQFRMVPNGGSGRYKVNVIFFARSLDIFQKGLGNLVALAKMCELVTAGVSKNTGRDITAGFMEGLITDVHAYEETFADIQHLLDKAANTKVPANPELSTAHR